MNLTCLNIFKIMKHDVLISFIPVSSEEWLKRMDGNKSSIKPIMESTYGKDSAIKWTVYWRTFFLSVAELFAYNNGEEWMVAHFLFKKK